MNRLGLHWFRFGIMVVGTAIALWFLRLLYGFFAFGDNHPVNAMLGVFGARPFFLNLAEMGAFQSILSLLSILIVLAVYVGLFGLTVIATYKVFLKLENRLNARA